MLGCGVYLKKKRNAGLIMDCGVEAWLIYRGIEQRQLPWLPVEHWIFTMTPSLTNRVKCILYSIVRDRQNNALVDKHLSSLRILSCH